MAEETNEISDKRPTGWGSLPFLIDLLEPVSHFVEAVRETLTSGNQMDSDIHKAVNFYCVPLQNKEEEMEEDEKYESYACTKNGVTTECSNSRKGMEHDQQNSKQTCKPQMGMAKHIHASLTAAQHSR
ncbi:uncharacterized protein LOC129301978 isoform X2 [Prosopis cineraria]|uniref:uncharacterized protein LOC129301978 isoform X2 n=1 Tax=Prosopis cineraria TaxID=364024 RepID=UPI00240EE11F|nr:uncharacterized protein LOC129301978 isoform X2 [Prosopis cineraria]